MRSGAVDPALELPFQLLLPWTRETRLASVHSPRNPRVLRDNGRKANQYDSDLAVGCSY